MSPVSDINDWMRSRVGDVSGSSSWTTLSPTLTAGGPGATSPDAKPPLYSPADDTFNLVAGAVSITAGDTEKGSIGIKRW